MRVTLKDELGTSSYSADASWSMMVWKWTVTRAVSRFLWLVELWMSSEILLNLSCEWAIRVSGAVDWGDS